MRENRLYWLLAAVVLLAVVGGAASLAYNAGISQGVAQSEAVLRAAPVPALPEVSANQGRYVGGGYYGPGGFGFGSFLFPLLFFVLIFMVLRGLFWRRRWHAYYGHPGERGGNWREGPPAPPQFEEWHRRAHESEQPRS